MFCMSETPVISTEKIWRDMNPSELAYSNLNFKIKATNWDILVAETSLGVYENPKSSSSVRPSFVEYGGMDANDWDIAELESEQFDNERDEMIETYRDQLNELHDKFGELRELKKKVEQGDHETIEEYSNLERERREQLEKINKPKQVN